MDQPVFCKPSKASGNNPSRYVYVAGLGAQLGSTEETIRAIFSSYGDIESIYLPEEKRYCYIAYRQESNAVAAVQTFTSGDRSLQKPKLLVAYAQLSTEKPLTSPEPPCTSTSKDIHIAGLRVLANFIDEETETKLLQTELCSHDSPNWEELLSRRIQHYGLIFNYRTLMLDYATTINPIPNVIKESILPSITKAAADFYEDKKIPYEFHQMTVNEYDGGQGIASHIDTDACLGPDLAILSLGSGVVMTFQERRPADAALAALTDYYPTPTVVARTIVPTKQGDAPHDAAAGSLPHDGKVSDEEDVLIDDEESEELPDVPRLAVSGAGSQGAKKYIRKKFLWLPPRSLLIMQSEARYNWSHGITPRASDKVDGVLIPRQRRVSLTFRQVMFPGEVPSSRLKSSELEVDHVFRVYDSIAVHWNHTRGRRKVHWHRVKAFLDDLPRGSLVADIGSGDGKYFNVNPGLIVIGCDRSMKLLQVSKEISHETFCCDAVKVPMRSGTFDATVCIAVFHHLASLDRRIALLRELLRITRVGGEIMIQAWALEQDSSSRWDFAGTSNSCSNSSSKKKAVAVAEENHALSSEKSTSSCGTAQQDVLVPWKLQKRFFMTNSNSKTDSANNDKESMEDEAKECDDGEEIECNHVVRQDDGSLLFQRYCHVFKKGELEDLCSSCPGNRVIESGWDRGNWFVRVMKTHSIETPSSIAMQGEDDAYISILSKAGTSSTGAMPRLATRL